MPSKSPDVMKDIEAFIKPKNKKKGGKQPGEDVYDLCDQMLDELSYLDQQLEKREQRDS